MPHLDEHYLRVRDYARKFSLDESTVYKMIERGELRAIRIGKKALRIPSSELERYLYPSGSDDSVDLGRRVEAFTERTGRDPRSFVRAWRAGQIEDTAENADAAIEALALRAALDRAEVPA